MHDLRPYQNAKPIRKNKFAVLARRMRQAVVMRIAIPQWLGRVSPVFDVAGTLLLIDIENGQETWREQKPLLQTEPAGRTAELLSLGVGVLICGAISASMKARLTSAGMQVIGFTCGVVDDVLAAFVKGGMPDQTFLMPGCHGCRRQQGGDIMPRGFGGGMGRGGGRSLRGSGLGRMGGPLATGPSGMCVCPNCGEKTPHIPGQPCQQTACPKCGAKMARSD